MGKKAKTGKNRQDKFYHLAKEQGFRSRAAFKLVQLNKRHDFLSSAARGVIDLCAAPGGWMQVARKHMPFHAPCIGIDLVPIRPVAGCVALVGDITADSTRAEVRRALLDSANGEKVDVILNDGSPNMGKAWLQDAYTQSELTLAALKLATDFLSPGGTFVSKVFRSNDYNSLLFVMHQLFQRVDATKPTASRTESAEIYVMCLGFKAPKSIDSRLLNAKYVFKDMSADPEESQVDKPDLFLNTVLKEMKRQKRHRGGYKDGETTFFKNVSILQFCETTRPVALMVDASQFSFEPRLMIELGLPESDAKQVARLLENLSETTSEFLSCCEDLKVLARREFKLLLKWRASARNALQMANLLNRWQGASDEVNDEGDSTKNVKLSDAETKQNDTDSSGSDESRVSDAEEELDEEMDKVKAEALAAEKRKRRKANKARNAVQRKIDMKIIMPDEEVAATNETADSLFSLSTATRVEKYGGLLTDVPVDIANIEGDNKPLLDGYDGDDDGQASDLPKNPAREPLRLEDPVVAKKTEAEDVEKELDRWYKIYLNHKKKDKNGLLLQESKERKRLAKRRALREAQENLEKQKGNSDDEEKEDFKLELNSSESSMEETEDELPPPSVDVNQSREAALWFSQPIFQDIDVVLSDDSSEYDGEESKRPSVAVSMDAVNDDVDVNEDFHSAARREAERMAVESDNEDREVEGEGFEVVAAKDPGKQEKGKGKGNVMEEGSDSSFHSSDYDTDEKAEMVAIGRQMKKSKKHSEELLDDAYNRYTFDDPFELPRWFADQDGEYRERLAPVSKAQVEEMKEYIKSLETRPTKKEAEAKARRRARLAKKMETMKAKANDIAEQKDVSVSSRMKAIEDLYKQAMKSGKGNKKNKKKVYQVVRPNGRMTVGKDVNKGRKALRGVHTTLVDRRLKADKRGIAKAQKRSKGKRAK